MKKSKELILKNNLEKDKYLINDIKLKMILQEKERREILEQEFKAKEEEIARLGLPGDIYVKQPKLDDQGNIKSQYNIKIKKL